MKHLTIILLIQIFLGNIDAQKADSVFQFIGNKGYENINFKVVNSLDLLPITIQDIALDFLKKRFNAYNSKIKFNNAQIFPLDSILENNLQSIKVYNSYVRPIPNYILSYSFKDSTLGISQYWVRIEMDKFGQVIECNFPLMNSDRKINSLKAAKVQSDSLLKTMDSDINIENLKISLEYSKENDILMWEFCYLKSTDLNQREYLCLILNVHDNSLIRHEGMGEIDSGGGCNCEVLQTEPEYRVK